MTKVTISVKLKIINLQPDIKQALDNYFNEYAKALNFCILRIEQIRKNIFFIGKKDKETKKWVGETGKCGMCGENAVLLYEDANYAAPIKICEKCKLSKYGKKSIRKLFVSTKERGKHKARHVDAWLDLRKVATLHNTHYHRVPDEACTIIEAVLKAKMKRAKSIKSDKLRLKEFLEVQKDPTKRVERPKQGNQREIRYVHISKKDTPSRGCTWKELGRKILDLQKKIERAERNIAKRKKIIFKGMRIRLDDDWVRFDLENSRISIPPLFKDLTFEITGPNNVMSKNSKRYFADWFERIKKQSKKYSYLLRKEKKGAYEYYLQYTYTSNPNEKNDYAGCLGVDIGLSKLACIAFYDAKMQKIRQPIDIFSNPIKSWKIHRRRLERILSSKKRVVFSKRLERQIIMKGVRHIRREKSSLKDLKSRIDKLCHLISKKIVDRAEKANAFIAMENLEGRIKEKQGEKEGKIQKSTRAMFLFRKLSKMIEYKALLRGIKVVYVKPDYTSQLCSACGSNNTRREKQAIFTCLNDQCRYFNKKINADFNAASNIAKKGLNNEDVVKIL